MSGDYSRWSFEPWRDFGAVLAQQGRIHTDADWNEWVSIVLRRLQAETVDALGRAVVPSETPDGFRIQAAGGNLTIGLGRAYVDGLLAENHGDPRPEWHPVLAELRGTAAIAYDKQPYYPNAPALPGGGPHLAYLKVWQREIGHVEQPSIVEKALGIDTTARLQTAWQVRLIEVPAGTDCGTPLTSIPAFVAAEPPAAGRLSSRTAEVPGQPDPCEVPAGGGFSGVENQLYRVEVHRGGGIGGANGATFKWSRDNATVASRVLEVPASLDRIIVDRVGRDDVLALHDGDWIEITDDVRELAGQPGEMRRIKVGGGIDVTTNTVILEKPLVAGTFPVDAQQRTIPARNTRVRRWDQAGKVFDAAGNELSDLSAASADGTIKIPTGATEVLLENGIVVRFRLDPTAGQFRVGDHWVMAARTVDGSVEALDKAPPRGTHAHYAPLALVTFPATVDDCRTIFPPLGGLDALEYVAGDGQEVTPDLVNPAPIPLPVEPAVGVARGPIPVAGRTVRFTVLAGNGTLDGGAGPVDKPTDAEGLATVAWVLDPQTSLQRLEAELLDASGQPTSLPVRFSARLRQASEVAYDPGNCPDLAGVTTVQEAIDQLCGSGGDHGSCCATVGSTGEFGDIASAIKELSARHDGHVCICLLPERHAFEMELVEDLRTFTLGGRGAVVECTQSVTFRNVDDLQINDVSVVDGGSLTRLFEFTSCGRVRLSGVMAATDKGDPDATVLVFEEAGNVRLQDCHVRNGARPEINERFVVLEDLNPIMRTVIEAARPGLSVEASSARIERVLGESEDTRRAVLSDTGAVIERHGALLGERDRATLLHIGEFVDEGAMLPPSRLAELLARVGRLGDRLRPRQRGAGTAVELLDGNGDVWIENCSIEGAILTYGRTTSDLEARTEQIIANVLEVGSEPDPPITDKGVGRLTLANNRLTCVQVAAEFEGRPQFAELHVKDNSLHDRPSFFLGDVIAFASNALRDGEERFNYLVAAGATSINGNLGGPQVSRLAIWSSNFRGAGNARLEFNVQLDP